MNYIKGKTALVTGASGGIGKRIAKDLCKKGAHVILASRNKAKLKKLAKELNKEGKASVQKLDVTSKKSLKELGKLDVDILINNAGLALGLDALHVAKGEDIDTVIDTNIKGALHVINTLMPRMLKKNSAHIINLGSVAGMQTYAGGGVYCATKSAMHAINEAINQDAIGTSLKSTTIAPGAVKTDFSNVRFKGDSKKAAAVYEGYEPLSAQDISHSVLHVLNTPPHVNIQFLHIMPTAQRSAYHIAKNMV